MFANVLHHGAQVFHVEQQQPLIVGDLEHQLQHAALGVVEVEQARQQQGPHVGNGGAHRVAEFAEHIPHHHRGGLWLPVGNAQCIEAFLQFFRSDAGHAKAGQIALGIGQKHRHTGIRQLFCHALQSDSLAGTGGPGNQAMAVGEVGQ